ncbi:hypothetical protein Tco_0381304 [Tanacetum coccineum]
MKTKRTLGADMKTKRTLGAAKPTKRTLKGFYKTKHILRCGCRWCGGWWCRCGESGGDGGDVVVMGTGWQWRVDGCGGDVVEIKVTRWWWRGDDDGVGDGSSGGCHGGVAAGWREVAERWCGVYRGGVGVDRG